jgi:hypothetical protein
LPASVTTHQRRATCDDTAVGISDGEGRLVSSYTFNSDTLHQLVRIIVGAHIARFICQANGISQRNSAIKSARDKEHFLILKIILWWFGASQAIHLGR